MNNTKIIYNAQQVSKKYPSFELKPYDISLELGKVYGLVGENAAGKTTLLRIIANDLLKENGINKYFFTEKDLPTWEITRNHVAYITQELQSWKGNMYEYVLFSATTHGLSPKEAVTSTEKIMKRLFIDDLGERKWTEISGGYKLRFAIAAAFVWHPKLAILDEPLANLDVNTQKIILEAMKEFTRDSDNPKAIILSSQHLLEIEAVADDLIHIQNGKLLFSGNKSNFEADRSENLFEFSCENTLEDLQNLFANENLSVRHNGFDFLITAPLTLPSNELLQKFIDKKIQISYFRNISQSSKKLFIHE
jgi:ABC-2 type transport system ATP-binding protein